MGALSFKEHMSLWLCADVDPRDDAAAVDGVYVAEYNHNRLLYLNLRSGAVQFARVRFHGTVHVMHSSAVGVIRVVSPRNDVARVPKECFGSVWGMCILPSSPSS